MSALETEARAILSRHFGGGQFPESKPRFTPAATEIVVTVGGSARFDERQSIVAFIRKRSVGVDHFVQRGRLTAAQGSDLQRWLGALADDIDAQLHDERDG